MLGQPVLRPRQIAQMRRGRSSRDCANTLNDLLHDDGAKRIEHEEHVLIGLHLVVRGVRVHDLDRHVAGVVTLKAADVPFGRAAKLARELNAHDLPEAAGLCREQQHASFACAKIDEDAVARDR